MRTILRLLLAAAALAAGVPAWASFHLFSMDELFSNADGSVQFLELTALAPGQQFVNGHTLVVTQGGTSHTFRIGNNLPGDTSGHRMLFGTQSFANLGIVRPDFVVPDGFFFTSGATITYAEGSDVWTYGALPTDGVHSLNRDGSTSVNSPQDFAGQTGSVNLGTTTPPPVPATGADFEGLWWRSPAGSESGWGVNITHQGDILFATWFTYDTNGNGMWLVMSDGVKTGNATFTGTLYRTTGPSFSATTFDPTQVKVTAVGNATFTFTDKDNGTFSYTVNGISQSKPITRQVFGSPVPTCTEGGTPPATPNYQDLWWRAPAGSESGWGVNITQQGTVLFATWFTYDINGNGMWLVMSNGVQQMSAGVDSSGYFTGTPSALPIFTGTLYQTTGPSFSATPWDPSQVKLTAVGNATFSFSDANNGTFAYTVNGVSQTKPITRQVFSSPTTVCQ